MTMPPYPLLRYSIILPAYLEHLALGMPPKPSISETISNIRRCTEAASEAIQVFIDCEDTPVPPKHNTNVVKTIGELIQALVGTPLVF